VGTDPAPVDARAWARLGFEAQRRYFTGYTGARDADFEAAERYLEMARRGLAPGDPLNAEVSFALGSVRIADHETRCAQPCPASAELAPITALLAAGGARDGAPLEQLYVYAMTVDKLYDHTHDPADVDLAITWLRRVAAHPRLSRGDRRRPLISLAIQHASQGAALREAQRRSGPGSPSWAAFGAAIEQFEEVLAGLAGRGRRSDKTRDHDRLDAWLGLLETYYQRGGGQAAAEDLDIMAGLARKLAAAPMAGYRLRAHALGRSGVLLIDRIMRRVGDPWAVALNRALLLAEPGPIGEAVTGVPGFDADLELAIGALSAALGLEDHAGDRQPLLTAALCSARGLRFLAYAGDEDLREFGRLCRIVMGHPHVPESYRRSCGEFLLVVLARQVQASSAGRAVSVHDATPLSPSADDDLDTMIGLLGRFAAADGAGLGPTLSSALAGTVYLRADGELSDAELAANYARQRDAAAAFTAVPAARALLLFQAAGTGAEWVRRGTGPAGLTDEVAAAFTEALHGFPATHPIALDIAAKAAAFAEETRVQPGPAAAPAAPGEVTAAHIPAAPDVFSLRVLPSAGVAVQGRLAKPTGQVAEVAESLLVPEPREDTSRASIRSVLALALHTRWLRERLGADLGRSIGQVRQAIDLLREGHWLLRARLEELLAGMLLDRAQAHGDHADADAALTLLEGLLARAGTEPAPGDLNDLLASAGPQVLGELLTASPRGGQPAPDRTVYRLELLAAIGSGLLLRALLSGAEGQRPARASGDTDDLSRSIEILRQVVRDLPADHARRPDALSDLGVALLAAGRDDAAVLRAGLEATREAAAGCPPGHPRRPAILLRTAAALAVNAQVAYVPELVDQGIDLLAEALRSAGLDTFGERSRCLYALGYALLIRYEHAGRAADLESAISTLEEARAGLEPVPGDPVMVPLLRALAWAYRQAGSSGPGLRRRLARSVGRSILHANVRAARAIGEDTLRQAGWCLEDGKVEAAIEALELGRALVLRAATVAADIPTLLRQVNRPDLADEWDIEVLASERGGAGRFDYVPSDLRNRVLTALRTSAAEQRMLSAPTVPQIAAALRAARMDGLVYLIPSLGEIGGHALIVHADGTVEECRLPGLSAGPGSPVARFAEAHHDLRKTSQAADLLAARQQYSQSLGDLCDWAWTAAIGPVLERLTSGGQAPPPRLIIAPVGILGIVPWHAARRGPPGQVRYACAEAVFATCASAGQFIEAAARRRRPLTTRSAVFVAGLSEDLPWSMQEADAICSALYPDAVRLGGSGQPTAARSGTPDEVLACLSASGLDGTSPAVLHVGCHAVARDTPDESRLELARGDLLISRILAQARTQAAGSPGGLIILAACTSDLTLADHDEALTLASAFLAAGATGVIGSRWEVSDLYTALLMFMLHRHLVLNPDDGPADALRAAQLWMLDPRRQVPAEMPAALAAQAHRAGACHPQAWAAFTYHGQ
jgi:hypothetical protein